MSLGMSLVLKDMSRQWYLRIDHLITIITGNTAKIKISLGDKDAGVYDTVFCLIHAD